MPRLRMAANEYQQVWRLASSASRRGVLQLSLMSSMKNRANSALALTLAIACAVAAPLRADARGGSCVCGESRQSLAKQAIRGACPQILQWMPIIAAALRIRYQRDFTASRTWTTSILPRTLWKMNRYCLQNERHERLPNHEDYAQTHPRRHRRRHHRVGYGV